MLQCSKAAVSRAALVLALAVGCLGEAGAEERPRASLRYHRAPGAEACLDEAALRAEVARRLGYDPFQEGVDPLITVEIRAAGQVLRARIVMSQGGAQTGERRLPPSPSLGDCRELSAALALAISIAVDPLSLGRPPAETTPVSPSRVSPSPVSPSPVSPSRVSPDPGTSLVTEPPPAALPLPADGPRALRARKAPAAEPPPEPTAEPAPPSPPASKSKSPSESEVAPLPPRRPEPRPEPPTAAPTRAGLGAGILGAIGSAPTVAVGFRVTAGVRRPRWSLHVEGRADLPASQPRGSDGFIRTWLAAASLVPCLHVWYFAGCAVFGAGAQWGAAIGFENPTRAVTPLAWAGVRAAIEFPIHGRLLLQFHVDLLAALTSTEYTVGVRDDTGRIAEVSLFRTPPLSGAMGVALVVLLGGPPVTTLSLGVR